MKEKDNSDDIIEIDRPARLLTVIKDNYASSKNPASMKVLKIIMYEKPIFLKDLVFYDKNSYTKTTIEMSIVMRHCEFINMKTLGLLCSHIENCEFLKFLNCPTL
jgi:hypothetical protein